MIDAPGNNFAPVTLPKRKSIFGGDGTGADGSSEISAIRCIPGSVDGRRGKLDAKKRTGMPRFARKFSRSWKISKEKKSKREYLPTGPLVQRPRGILEGLLYP